MWSKLVFFLMSMSNLIQNAQIMQDENSRKIATKGIVTIFTHPWIIHILKFREQWKACAAAPPSIWSTGSSRNKKKGGETTEAQKLSCRILRHKQENAPTSQPRVAFLEQGLTASGNVAESHCVPILAPLVSVLQKRGEPIALQNYKKVARCTNI